LADGERVFVLWEGVTHYLGEAAVDQTLRTLAAELAPGSRVLFTYLHGGLLDGTASFDGARNSMDQVAGDGEPWIWGIHPERLPAFLAARGWRCLENLGANEYRERYWGEQGRRMRGFAFYRVALAEGVGG
jgi:O-methyltransferase involved in polyketide biosynthesis